MTGTILAFNRAAPDRLRNILDRLCAIPDGREIVDFLEKNNIPVILETGSVPYAAGNVTIRKIEDNTYIYGDCAIYLNEELNDDNLLQALIHETQHMRQHLSGLGNPDFWPSDEDHCLLRRVQEADAQATTTLITYLLKLNGDAGPWEEVQKTDYTNMARAFEKEDQTNPLALYNGEAQRAAFNAWFDNDKTARFYDRDTIKHQITFLKGCLWNNPGHAITEGPLTAEWLERIGDLSPVNYMKLRGYPPVTEQKYRKNILQNISIAPQASSPELSH